MHRVEQARRQVAHQEADEPVDVDALALELLAKAWSLEERIMPRSAVRITSPMRAEVSLPSPPARSSSSSERLPVTAVKMLFSSWATAPASSTSAVIFSASDTAALPDRATFTRIVSFCER
jgi:hypothetical protein